MERQLRRIHVALGWCRVVRRVGRMLKAALESSRRYRIALVSLAKNADLAAPPRRHERPFTPGPSSGAKPYLI